MSTPPKTIADNQRLIDDVYNYIPKRVLWDIFWDAASRLCPVGEESIDKAMEDPEARGSIVEWIMGESIVRESWFPKRVLKKDEPVEERQPTGDPRRFTDDIPTTVVSEKEVKSTKAKKKAAKKSQSTKAKKRAAK